MWNDEQLWLKLKAGDRDAFELLFRRYHKDLYRYGIKFCGDRQTVEDEIQNLFLKIWVRKNSLGDVTGVKTYLWTALRRRLISTQKRQKRELNEAGTLSAGNLFSLSIEEFIIKNEHIENRKREIAKAIETLSPRQKEILYLKFYEGMSYEEIEEIMGINYQVARNYLSGCLQKLRGRMTTETPELISLVWSLMVWSALSPAFC